MSTSSRQSRTARSQSPPNVGCLRTFFLLFFLVGTVPFYFVTVRPLMQCVAATRWVETPCTVVSSQVKMLSADPNRRNDKPTYKIEVVYRYAFGDTSYTSWRYQFETGSTGGRAGKQRVVDQYPAGRKTVCYVDPASPGEAVINRYPNSSMAFGSFFLIFTALGGLGIWYAPRLSTPQQTFTRNALPVAGATTGEPAPLKPQSTPLGKFLGLLAFAVIWNGFIGIFAYLVFFSRDSHSAPLFAKIFVGFFCLIGVLKIVSSITSFLALFNPRLMVTARTMAVPLGGEFQFQWRIQGRAEKITKVRIVLEGREEAVYRSGKDVHTATQVFAEIPVLETIDHDVQEEGQGHVMVPAGLMHTFTGRHNKVIWRLRVRAEIPHWPDIVEDYPISVLPPSSAT